MTTPQQRALEFVETYAQSRCEQGRPTLEHICRMGNIEPGVLDEVVAKLQAHAQVVIKGTPYLIPPAG
jgi:hypothetical protein